MIPVLVSFVAFLVLFAAIGMMSMRRRREAIEDYLLAGRNVSPWLTALSSVVTNNSGYMFIGLIGFTYTQGISAIWLTIGWIVGDAVAWYTIHPRLRAASDVSTARTVGMLIAEAVPGRGRGVIVALGVVTLLFLATYAAAQFNAGSKAVHVLLGWNIDSGALIAAGLVLLYSYAGGIRASIWTDAAQSMVMMVSMVSLAVLSFQEVGGLSGLLASLRDIDPALVDPVPRDLRFGFGLFVFGWLAAGFGVVGQPHILIRTMALDDPKHLDVARRIYFGWYVPFAVCAVLVALSARVILPDIQAFDAELALPTLAHEFMPGVFVGLVLASIFASTISTADSQLLSCSAAITQDLFPETGQSYVKVKVATAGVTLIALGIVYFGPSSVFDLVIIAWSGLASGIGPLMLVRLYGRPVRTATGLAMIAAGVGTVIVWNFVLGWTRDIYEVLPGMAAAGIVYAAARLLFPPARPPDGESAPPERA